MKQMITALKMLILMIVLLGLIYPLFITFISSIILPKKAGGSLIIADNRVIGSELIAQNFKGEQYFWPRPSAVNYDPMKPAGGSNLSPTSQKLKEQVEERVKKYAPKPPVELVYASGSGLDPHISLETAYYQIERIAKSRNLTESFKLRVLVNSLAEGVGQQYVNVLLLNRTLDQKFSENKND